MVKTKIIDGAAVAKEIKNVLAEEIINVKEQTCKVPSLSVILVGNNPASEVYVKLKHKVCNEIGVRSNVYKLDAKCSEKELITLVEDLNKDISVNGILVQLPLPAHIREQVVLEAIDPIKDVDCFHPENFGLLFLGKPRFIPCTPHGIITLLHKSSVDLAGKEVVVIGRSNIVGKPIAMLLTQQDATVTLCHSKTVSLDKFTLKADVLVVAVGKACFINSDMVKNGSIIIDVGMNRAKGKVLGDVDFDSVYEKVKYITPVPGGVGPMTIAMLMKNTLHAFKLQNL
jgi:methylenetetrahydrofolate dehydrogenase (NADP+) / methenyltetrahydrofolate cyclohydrolase